jgi:hypothetical protein
MVRVRILSGVALALLLLMLALFIVSGRRGVLTPDEARAASDHGAGVGKTTSDDGCLTEALGRGVSCRDDVHCEAEATAFLRGCLAASTRTEHFCDDVPSPSELLPSGTWSHRVWDAQGRPHHGGMIADGPVRAFCHPE